MLTYPATFEKDGPYILVQFPDIPEAITQASSLEKAYLMAKEVLRFALDDYSNFPIASPLEEIQDKFPEKYVALITIDIDSYQLKYNHT